MNKEPYPTFSGSSDFLKQMAAQPIWDSWSNELFPRNLQDALYWGNLLRTRNGDLVAANRRAVCYFLNGIELTGNIKDLDSKDYYTELLEKDHHIMQQILAVALDLQFYGNSFTSLFRTITRTLVCPKCYTVRYLKAMERGKDYDFEDGEFISTCSCGYHGAFKVKDKPENNTKSPFNVVSWNPLSISLDYCSMTNYEKIAYTPQSKDKEFLANTADSAALESMPMMFIQALVEDRIVSFKPDGCLHLKLPPDSMTTTESRGWGIPSFLPAFKYVIMLMLLERQLEAAVKDFILPIRLIFPDASASKGGSDPISMSTNVLHMGDFRNKIENALRGQARQQSSWQLIPAPVQQLTLGGDGKVLVPVEILQYAKEQLLDTQCVPLEFYKATISQANSTPVSFRMFEQTWEREVCLWETYLNFYLKNCQQQLGWPSFVGALMRQSVSTDPNRMQMMMDLSMGPQPLISQTTMLRALNINPKQERTRIIEDQINLAKMQQDTNNRLQDMGILNDMFNTFKQQNLEQAMQEGQGAGAAPAGAAPAGGAMPPAGPAGAPPAPGAPGQVPMGMEGMDVESQIRSLVTIQAPDNATPDQLQADAQTVAMLLMKTPVGAPRNQIYSLVKRLNPTLYDIAKSALQKVEQQAKQQGLEQARQQQ